MYSQKSPRKSVYEVIVVGSGPGGAVSARILSEHGFEVLVLEEGSHLPTDQPTPFSPEEMIEKYRDNGLTLTLGSSPISYVEGRVVGGGSEVNAGLYHRTPEIILKSWADDYKLAAASPNEMEEHFKACESALSISYAGAEAPQASFKLKEGAEKLNWRWVEVPRWFKKEGSTWVRQSMSRTFLASSELEIYPNFRVRRIQREKQEWMVFGENNSVFKCKYLFVCAGAIQTPFLLKKSGIHKNVGKSLQLHPTIKATAKFSDFVSSMEISIPVHQVKEFTPKFSLGCSVSKPGHLALGLVSHRHAIAELKNEWRNFASYYAMAESKTCGEVLALPGLKSPVVRYNLTSTDYENLAQGLTALSEVLFNAGAREIFPTLTSWPSFKNYRTLLAGMPRQLPAKETQLMTIHLFASCPAGEDRKKCAVNSFGKVFDQENLFLNDASILCSAPGVNPQGTVMALARRNVLHFIENRKA